ncbi:MAG: Mor transcription activator family protein [Hydrogenophaga sp.]
MSQGRMEERRNELFEDVVQQSERLLLEYGVSEKAANLIANALADHLADQWGGQNLNLPKDYRRKLSARELEIYERFNGSNVDQLALEYGMTERGVRKLINRTRERLRRNAQGIPQLFETA